MKKSLRVLSLVLSVVMIMSCVTVLGYAHVAYRGNDAATKASLKFDDTNFASFTTDQYASMALDELDRMLASANLSVNIYIGTLDLTSIDNLINSVESVWAAAQGIKGLLDDAQYLNLNAITGKRRTNTSDLEMIYAVLDLLGDQAGIAQKYVNGQISLGMLNSVIADYVFNVRSLVFGLLAGLTGVGGVDDDYDYFDTKLVPPDYADPSDPTEVRNGATLTFLQDILNKLVLGEWKQLDDLFYSSTNKSSWVVFDEYMFHDGDARDAQTGKLSGAIVTETEPNAAYDYYGWVHPDGWVTFGLGDAIRVPHSANGSNAPAPSFDAVNFTGDKLKNTSVYDLVETLLLQAYNGIAVPVLNRITANWLREKCGYTFDKKYTERYLKDANGNDLVNDQGEKVINPDYDYLYKGEAPAGGAASTEAIFNIFKTEDINIPYAEVSAPYTTFINALNHNAIAFVDSVIKATKSVSGNVSTYTWTDKNDANISYSFSLTDGANEDNLMNNIINVLKFILQATGEEFFSKGIINRGEFKTPAEIADLDYQGVLSYIIRSVINSNVDWMYIPDQPAYQTIPGACMEAVKQLAYQDIPQMTYTSPAYNSANDIQNILNKALAILMDVAAYNLNANLDAEYAAASNSTYAPVAGSGKITGLLPYVGDSGSYGTTVAAVAAWAVTTYASTTIGNSDTNYCLINLDLNSDNGNGSYANLTEDQVWADLDLLLNSLVDIKGNDAWINTEISNQNLVSKAFIFDYLVKPILTGNWNNIYKIFQRNSTGVLNSANLETVLLTVVKALFDDLFPNLFPADLNSLGGLDGILQNSLLANAVYDLLKTLMANYSGAGAVNPNLTINGRGKIIAGVALPIVCQILGLSADQEFGELENYAPAILIPDNNSKGYITLYNGSSGVNTSYRTADGNYTHTVDNLYSYTIQTATCNVISGGSGSHTITDVVAGTSFAGGENKVATISGLQPGELLEITYTYKVYDETGTSLKVKNAQNQDVDAVLSNTKYCYVADKNAAKGDGEDIVSINVGGHTVSYAPNVYLTGGLSKLNDYTVKIESGSNASASTGTVTGVAWLNSKSESASMQEGGTYLLHPFSANTEAYKRTEYEYEKDENGNYVLDDWGMKIKTSAITEDGITNVADGLYVANYTITAGGGSSTIQVYIHVFDDYGLSSLVDRAVSANRTAASYNSQSATAFTAYRTALLNGAKFVYQLDNHGFVPGVRDNEFENYISSQSAANKYLELYRALYAAIEDLEEYAVSSGAQAIWNAVNAVLPYNYDRKSFTYNGNTLWYKDYYEYNDAAQNRTYQYVGMRNYVAHTYKSFKNFVNDANDLINREFKYIPYTQDEFNELTAEEKAKVVEDYTKQEPGVISSVESAYILHMISLKAGRLISLTGNRSKLELMYNLYGTQQKGNRLDATWQPYAAAKAFANTVINDASTNGEQINTAMNKLIATYKDLADGANLDDLETAINYVQAALVEIGGIDYTTGNAIMGHEDVQEAFTPESFRALLEAYQAAVDLDNQKDELTLGDQARINAAEAELYNALDSLVEVGSGGDGDFVWDYDEEFEIEGPNGEIWTPYVDDAFFESELDITEIETDDYGEIPILGIIYGVPGEILEDPDAFADFLTVEGGYVDYVYYNDAALSSGSLFVFFDEDDEPQGCLVVAYRGDLNSDADFTIMDMICLNNAVAEFDGYIYSDPECPEVLLCPSADLTGDGSYDIFDLVFLNNVLNADWMINQTEGGRYEE